MQTTGTMQALFSVCTIVSLWTGVARCDETIPFPRNAEVRVMHEASQTLSWAAERVAKELEAVHGVQVSQVSGAEGLSNSESDKLQVILGTQASLDQWTKEQALRAITEKPGSNAYSVTTLHNPLRVIIIGSDDIGAWYGACEWMDSLIESSAAGSGMAIGELSGKPELAIRFTRGVGAIPLPGGKTDGAAAQNPVLDWWARWRMNATVLNDATPDYLAELHKRGIKAIINLRVRRMCAAEDKQVADLAAAAERFFEAGGDGVYMLWDDLPEDRCFGHCDKCRERFGPQSLPHEHVRPIEAVCDVAAKYSEDKLVIWCPSHYSRSRY